MIRLYTLTSDLHREMAANAADEPFIQRLQTALGESFTVRGEDFSDYGSGDATDLMKSSENVLNRLDEMFKEVFPSGLTKEFVQQVKLFWKLGDSVVDLASVSFHEITRALVTWQAYQQTSESWINFWTMVMAEAAVESGSEHGKLIKLSNTGDIADEIEKNLADVQAAKETSSFVFVP